MPEAKDEVLDDYLTGNTEVSRRYRETATESSPARLDDLILRAARRELRPQPRRWMLPLSLAAAVLLSMSVILRLPQEGLSPQPARQKATSETAPASAPSPAADAPVAPVARAEQKAATPSRPAVPAPAPAPASAAAPAPTAEPFANSAADNAPAAEEKQEAAPLSQPAAKKAQGVERQSAPSAAGMLAPRRDEASPAAAEERDAMTPASWIARIRELQRSGKTGEAADELKNFRASYPDYVLPPDLSTEDVRP
jgi:hypothetical protein